MAKTTHVEPIITDLTDSKILEFLNSQKKSTQSTYRSVWRKLSEFTTESGEQMLKNHKAWLKHIFEYAQYLKQKGYSSNYISMAVGSIRGFFSYNRKPLVLTRPEKKRLKGSRTTEDHFFSNEDLAKMYLVGSVKARYVVAVGKSIGLRASDFSLIKYGDLRALDLNDDLPVFLGERNTIKEGVKAFCFLDSDAVQAVKALLEATKEKPDTLKVWTQHPDDLSPLLQRLAKKAGIQTNNKHVRFHGMRRFLFDNLNRVVSIEKAKMYIGKQLSESAYLSPQTLREDFKSVMPMIAFNGNGIKSKISALEQALTEKDALIQQQQAQIEQLKTQQAQNQNTMQKMDTRLTVLEEVERKRPEKVFGRDNPT